MSEETPTPEATEAAPVAPSPGTPEYDAAMAAKGTAHMEGVPAKFQNADGSVNMEAFAKSYMEMEKQFHAGAAAPAEEATPEPEVAPEPEAPAPETLQISEPEPEPEPAAEPTGVSEEKWGQWKTEIMRGGDVTPESRAELKALGFNDNIINDFVSAHKSQLKQGMTAAAEVVGGDERIAKIFGWASNNLDETAREQVNAGLAGPAWEVTLRGLEAQYDRAAASAPKAQEMTHKVTTANPAASETIRGFGSVNEFAALRADPKYGKDATYTNQVNSRAAMTDWTKIS